VTEPTDLSGGGGRVAVVSDGGEAAALLGYQPVEPACLCVCVFVAGVFGFGVMGEGRHLVSVERVCVCVCFPHMGRRREVS
jgi:hypothetical protein